MAAEGWYLAAVLAGALALFYTGKLRPDVTAMLVMLSLLVPWRPGAGGPRPILAPQEAFSGFGSPAVIMVTSMFVLSAAMSRTGAAQLLGGVLQRAGSRSPLALQLAILTLVTLFSAFVNDTTTVLVWMPLVLAICRERGWSPSLFLLPLAYASLLGGQWTLIGTRSNIIVSDYLRTRTGEGLSFFIFTPVAAAIWVVAMLYFRAAGLRMLPKGTAEASLAERYDVQEYLTEVMAAPGSGFAGRTLEELDLAGRHHVTVLNVIRDGVPVPPTPGLRLGGNDVLVIQGRIGKITDLLGHPGLQVKQELRIGDRTLRSVDLRMVEALLAPGSALLGKILEEVDLEGGFGVSVLAVGRHGHSLGGSPMAQRLQAGDSLLLIGHEMQLDRLRRHPDLYLLESRSLPATGRRRALWVLGLMLLVILGSATGLLAPAFVIPLAAALAVLTRCVGMRGAYESLDLPSIVVVAGMIPFGLALEKTGTARALAEAVAAPLRHLGPFPIFAALTLATILLTQVIENAAVAIVLSPIAYEMAASTGANPAAFLLGVAICVSSAFMTPVAHESTILVMAPGRYEFRDYLRVGTPLAFLTWLVTMLVLPLCCPLGG